MPVTGSASCSGTAINHRKDDRRPAHTPPSPIRPNPSVYTIMHKASPEPPTQHSTQKPLLRAHPQQTPQHPLAHDRNAPHTRASVWEVRGSSSSTTSRARSLTHTSQPNTQTPELTHPHWWWELQPPKEEEGGWGNNRPPCCCVDDEPCCPSCFTNNDICSKQTTPSLPPLGQPSPTTNPTTTQQPSHHLSIPPRPSQPRLAAPPLAAAAAP